MGKNALKVSNTDLADAIRDRVAGIVQNCKDDGKNDVELYNRIYGDRDIQDGSKKNKICQLRQGKTVTLDDIAALADFTQMPIEYILTGKKQVTDDTVNTNDAAPTAKSLLQNVAALLRSSMVKTFEVKLDSKDGLPAPNSFNIFVKFSDPNCGFNPKYLWYSAEIRNGLKAIASTFDLPPSVQMKALKCLETIWVETPLLFKDESEIIKAVQTHSKKMDDLMREKKKE